MGLIFALLAGLVADGYDDAVLEPLRAQIAALQGRR